MNANTHNKRFTILPNSRLQIILCYIVVILLSIEAVVHKARFSICLVIIENLIYILFQMISRSFTYSIWFRKSVDRLNWVNRLELSNILADIHKSDLSFLISPLGFFNATFN